jgi:hypothetical protein
VPQAIGARAAQPGREVVPLPGDGGVAILAGDLITLDQVKGFRLYATRSVLSGRGDELIDLVKTNVTRRLFS